jgi:DNA-binding NarL/FixJ family response regulator
MKTPREDVRPAPAAPPSRASGRAASVKKRVFLVDDHPFMRAGLAQLIERQPDLAVCGEAGNPAEAFRDLPQAAPDLLLADITMPGRSGLEFIKDLSAQYPDLVILVVSMHDEAIYAERAIRAGARGYIMKETGGDNLLGAMRQVLREEVYVSPRMAANLLDGLSARRPRGSSSPIEKLTDREFEIFRLIGQGKSTRDIAGQLHLSPKTVDVHRSHIKGKLGLTGATALVHRAVRWLETSGSEA